jgi:hypothetical protein
MIRACCSRYHVGPKVMGEIEPYEDLSITSAICDGCFPRDMEDIRRQMFRRTLLRQARERRERTNEILNGGVQS